MIQADQVKTKADAISSMASLIDILKNTPGADRAMACKIESAVADWDEKCEAEVLFLFARVKQAVGQFIDATILSRITRGMEALPDPDPEHQEFGFYVGTN
ncbi:MAG: hypothetical protein ACYSUV_16965 [Planctomycetota bacterium]|jgi:hypothetical protein